MDNHKYKLSNGGYAIPYTVKYYKWTNHNSRFSGITFQLQT